MSRWRDAVNDHASIAKALSHLESILPPLNFITIHYAYFIIVSLLASVIFWGSSNPTASVSYTDSLFLVVSAMTEAGLNTANLSQLTTWQQTLLFLLIIFGSSIWVSIWTVVARKHVFEKRFHDIVRAERMRRANRAGSTLSLPRFQRFMSFRKALPSPAMPSPMFLTGLGGNSVKGDALPIARRSDSITGDVRPEPAGSTTTDAEVARPAPDTDAQPVPHSPGHIVFADEIRPATEANTTAVSSGAQYHGHGSERHPAARRTAAATPRMHEEHEKSDFNMGHFFAYRTAGRNGQFHDLSTEERDRLGGCEYRALKVLSVLVPLYFFLWQFLGCIALGAWINNNQPEPPLTNGIRPWWLGIFNGASAFNNSGMSLLDANMIPFQNSTFVLITMGLLILAGNTAYPIFLRLIIWSLLQLSTLLTEEADLSDLKDTFRFILQYPRRVYTNLFPSRPTWWLFFMLILLNSVDWVAFELLNLGNPAIESIPTGSRVLDGLFQALG